MGSEVIVGSLLAIVALIAVVSFASLGCVEQNEYGLLYNWVTKTITDKVYHGGTHLIGPWNSFVTFPATVRTLEFSDRIGYRTAEALHTRTKEGLGLHLSISFQYLLDPERIPQLYALTNQAYEGLFTRIARDQLLEAASEYEGPEYWLDRKTIGDHMRRLVDQQLQASYSKLWGLQLLVIDLPDNYEASITMTQVSQQLAKTRKNEQFAASIRADTEVLRADFARDIEVVQAGAKANYTLATKLAEAEASRRKIAAEADALGYVRKKLGLTALGAVKYQQLSAYEMLENATILADVPGALPVLGVGGGGAAASLLQRSQSHRAEAPAAPAATESSNSTGYASSSFLQEDDTAEDVMDLAQKSALYRLRGKPQHMLGADSSI